MYQFSVDPGSSDKGWSVWSATGTRFQDARHRTFAIARLSELVEELCACALVAPVALSLDAPIRVFGGLQAPADFSPRNVAPGESRKWPFDVNAFSQRPCEKALTSRPTVRNASLSAEPLAKAVARLCGWSSEYKDSHNQTFVDLHPGVSVRGYMGAPHAPVVRTFLAHLVERAAGAELQLVYEPRLVGAGARTIHILETHPAVTLGFYASSRVAPFPASIPVYKGSKTAKAACASLSAALVDHISASYGTRLAAPSNDDDLDGLVGLLNLVDLLEDRGDVFGTADDGYFLVPACPGLSFETLWSSSVSARAAPL